MKKKKKKEKKKRHSQQTRPAHSPKSFTGYAARSDLRRPQAAYRISVEWAPTLLSTKLYVSPEGLYFIRKAVVVLEYKNRRHTGRVRGGTYVRT
jgi:hypothetical protein